MQIIRTNLKSKNADRMRLDKIKLVGFKSFVDPTTVSFSSNLTGIVGPNGCGKSNVIDAVRWVMGESSAKQLRGESMADVIFNGSSTRKPIGQASVELLFDNSDGSCPGQYASFNEISIRRLVSRDGTSTYYLNGTRCRRRDIMDLFFGTGIGPRSYSIIEQGMISRFIEAKPDDMRVFIEEAAGISKYKERRRETETRIKHTRENLDRINDLRDELEKQLAHLQRQAKMAEKYKVLKEEERLTRAQLLALRHKGVNEHAASQQRIIAEKETAYEAAVAELRGVESKLEHLREQHTEAHDDFNQVQGDFYKLGADVARIEQAIQHSKEKHQQLQLDSKEAEASLTEARGTLDTDNQRISSLDEQLAEIEPAMDAARQAEQASSEALSQAEDSMQDWQLDWEEFNRNAAEPSKTVQVEQTRIQHLEEHQQQLLARVSRYENELQELGTQVLEQEIKSLREQISSVDKEISNHTEQLQNCQQQISHCRQQDEQFVEKLDSARRDLQSQQGRLSSLEALQEDALGKSEGAAAEWLDQHGLQNARRLAETIVVEQRWQTAIETVLGFHLQAVGVEEAGNLGQALAGLSEGAIGIIERKGANDHNCQRDIAPSLAQFVKSDWPLDSVLAGIYTADSIDQALTLRSQLQAHESVVTAEGVWLGQNWMRMTCNTDAQSGVLQREQEIRDAEQHISTLATEVAELQRQLDEGRQALHEHEQHRDDLQATLDASNRKHAEIKTVLGSKQTSLEQLHARYRHIQTQLDELRGQLDQEASAVDEAHRRLQQAESQAATLDQERAQLDQRRDNLRETLEQAREQARSDYDAAHQHALRIESIRAELNSTRQGMQRIESQIATLQQRHTEIQTFISDGEAPLQQLQQDLGESLKSRQGVEEKLNAARKQVQDIEHAMRAAGDDSGKADQNVQAVRGELEELRLDYQGISVRLQTLQEQIDETTYTLQTLLEGLSEDASEESWQARVEKLERSISRLGAINLAAIEEFKERSERKEYLDKQMDDLNDALKTLENAINKIDHETRTRFKETFDKVNNGLKEMFPRLFGGGHAYMELTDNDLLSTGITIMAQPPGKRNGTIHLLSGGEKALTAVALVFAIFELNPAPFCMLDEVDAPLDDANVARFCELVSDMSDRIQFIFITHNKLTMELAGQLMGVTMSEPGVSRLVAVDVDEAASMAAM